MSELFVYIALVLENKFFRNTAVVPACYDVHVYIHVQYYLIRIVQTYCRHKY